MICSCQNLETKSSPQTSNANSNNSEKVSNAKVFNYNRAAYMLIPKQDVDLYPVLEKYPNLTRVTISSDHGGGRYSSEYLEENNYVIEATVPMNGKPYIVQVEIPQDGKNSIRTVQFNYEL